MQGFKTQVNKLLSLVRHKRTKNDSRRVTSPSESTRAGHGNNHKIQMFTGFSDQFQKET